jgi:hypothetical protein
MKARMVLVILLFAIVALLLVGRFVLAEQGGQYVLEAGRGLSSSVQPATLGLQVRGEASGGAYSLSSVALPEMTGSGCCCTYLPAMLRNTP